MPGDTVVCFSMIVTEITFAELIWVQKDETEESSHKHRYTQVRASEYKNINKSLISFLNSIT